MINTDQWYIQTKTRKMVCAYVESALRDSVQWYSVCVRWISIIMTYEIAELISDI